MNIVEGLRQSLMHAVPSRESRDGVVLDALPSKLRQSTNSSQGTDLEAFRQLTNSNLAKKIG